MSALIENGVNKLSLKPISINDPNHYRILLMWGREPFLLANAPYYV
jgi:hypothetical protein